jgi:hypothetical protein
VCYILKNTIYLFVGHWDESGTVYEIEINETKINFAMNKGFEDSYNSESELRFPNRSPI